MITRKYRQEKDCLNCGATVEKKFCSNCGQENLEQRDNVSAFVFNFIAGYFDFDSKIIRTTIALFTKPGFLTREYWQGKRVRYIEPLRLYLFSIILSVIITTLFYEKFKDRIASTTLHASELGAKSNDQGSVSKDKAVVIQSSIDNFYRDIKAISFFLLPVSAFIFYVMYRRQREYYVDHLIYTFHQQAFISLAGLIILIIPVTFNGLFFEYIDGLSVVIMVVYTAISLKYLYRESWGKTIWKSFLSTFIVLLLMVLVMFGYMMAGMMQNKV